jgi:type VI secretion system protein ImpF
MCERSHFALTILEPQTMAELVLNDRLQPALLDRLIDDERSVALVKVTASLEGLEQLGLSAEAFVDILRGQGLMVQQQQVHAGLELELHCTASREQANPARLRALLIKPPRAPDGVTLQSFATFESRAVLNTEIESLDRRMISMRRLRECVHRDLGWLFNTINLDSEQDLSATPHVASSVLNFGLPSFAGQIASTIDLGQVAERLRRAITQFEPRLSNVRVSPRGRLDHEDDGTLEFNIEAELWGQPVSQHLQLRTKIDLMNGDITVIDGPGT